MTTRVALVTGASRGIGRASARALARAGYHVIGVARSQKALESLDDEITREGGTATLAPFDLKDFDAIDRLGGVIFERWGKLDALCAGAAFMGDLMVVGEAVPKMVEEIFATNVLANQRLIRSVDPLLRAADPKGRAVFLGAGAALDHLPFWGPYAASKAALEMLALTYAQEVGFTGVKANVLDPGPTRSTLRLKAYPGEDQETLKSPDVVATTIVEMLAEDFPRNGARIVLPK